MKSQYYVFALSALLAVSSSMESKAQPPSEARTPPAVVRAFLLAMVNNDEADVRKEILPNPKAEILWQGETARPEDLPEIKKQFDGMTCRECKVGEIINLPGGRKLKVTDQMVNEKSQLLFPIFGGEPFPTPLPVVKVDGEWKVNAESLIAARLTAKRAEEKKTSQE